MVICILGVCGTFMANIACLAKALGHEVVGYDNNAYPPMSDLLAQAGIEILPMPETPSVPNNTDLIIVGNSVRGDGPWAPFIANGSVPYQSGPDWLNKEVLSKKKVICIAGTHGKTTTTSMMTALLRGVGEDPGYLIGGVCPDFAYPAHLGESDYFVIESDEYSTAFFDHGPKFMHYNPFVFLLNNVEFDHADIYDDLAAIEAAFANGVALVPDAGALVFGADSASAAKLAETATTTQKIAFGDHADWSIGHCSETGQQFDVCHHDEVVAHVDWQLCGHHNQLNAVACVAIAAQLGIDPAEAGRALSTFNGVRRRLEYLGQFSGVEFYDDFAHHPTAIAETLAGLKAKVKGEPVLALLHFASNTMRSGLHDISQLVNALSPADRVVLLVDGPASWDVEAVQSQLPDAVVAYSMEEAGRLLQERLRSGEHLIFMSNKSLHALQNQLMNGNR